jgi:tocopherol O-methyltransferase
MQPKAKQIIEYYDSCECDYRTFWDLDRSMAMHAGFWDDKTSTLSEALSRENEVLAEHAQIKPHEKVLDAGCGVGGSSIFLAKQIGCHVTGITLSAKQVETARRFAQKHGVASRTSFETMDFCHTTFPDASFDIVWGIESICHADDKSAFVKEAYRLLKAGGRLIMADGFGTKETYTKAQSKEMGYWLNGWGVDALETQSQFFHHFVQTGFGDISYRNMTHHVLPSSKKLHRISFPALAMSKVGEWVGLRTKIQTKNLWAAYYQYRTLKKGLWEYGIFCAHKT